MPPKSKRFSLIVGYNIWPSSSTTNQNAALIIDPQDHCSTWILLISFSRLRSSADILVLGPQQTQRITGKALRISFHPDWQINNGIFNRPIRARTQIQVRAQNKDFGALLQTDLPEFRRVRLWRRIPLYLHIMLAFSRAF